MLEAAKFALLVVFLVFYLKYMYTLSMLLFYSDDNDVEFCFFGSLIVYAINIFAMFYYLCSRLGIV